VLTSVRVPVGDVPDEVERYARRYPGVALNVAVRVAGPVAQITFETPGTDENPDPGPNPLVAAVVALQQQRQNLIDARDVLQQQIADFRAWATEQYDRLQQLHDALVAERDDLRARAEAIKAQLDRYGTDQELRYNQLDARYNDVVAERDAALAELATLRAAAAEQNAAYYAEHPPQP
jgi:uncharacterized protein YlxW (UPF0749 family)